MTLSVYSPSIIGVNAGLEVQDQPELHEAQFSRQHNTNSFVFISADTTECPPAKDTFGLLHNHNKNEIKHQAWACEPSTGMEGS